MKSVLAFLCDKLEIKNDGLFDVTGGGISCLHFSQLPEERRIYEWKTKDCPDDDTLLNYIEGFLSKEKIAQIQRHFVLCEVCREVTEVGIEIKREVESDLKYHDKTPICFVLLYLPPVFLN